MQALQWGRRGALLMKALHLSRMYNTHVHVSAQYTILTMRPETTHGICAEVWGVTDESKDTGGALSVQADHPVAEHGEEQRGDHPHGHNVKQQDCCVVGGRAIGSRIPLPARDHTKSV